MVESGKPDRSPGSRLQFVMVNFNIPLMPSHCHPEIARLQWTKSSCHSRFPINARNCSPGSRLQFVMVVGTFNPTRSPQPQRKRTSSSNPLRSVLSVFRTLGINSKNLSSNALVAVRLASSCCAIVCGDASNALLAIRLASSCCTIVCGDARD
jgi:hypothetical protein